MDLVPSKTSDKWNEIHFKMHNCILYHNENINKLLFSTSFVLYFIHSALSTHNNQRMNILLNAHSSAIYEDICFCPTFIYILLLFDRNSVESSQCTILMPENKNFAFVNAKSSAHGKCTWLFGRNKETIIGPQ